MKRILVLVTVALLLALGASIVSAQSGYDLFQKALVKERAVGDVEEAIRLYQRVVNEFASNHPLAAKAELRLGLLYERLGRKGEAQRAFKAVVNQYADQTDIARQAKAKITADAPARSIASGTNRKTTGLTVRQVWAGLGGQQAAISPDGRYLGYFGRQGGPLYIRDSLTGEDRRLTIVGPSWDMDRIINPTFSPDGKLIAYGLNNRDHTDLVLITPDGSTSRVLYHSDKGEGLAPFGWSSDSKHVLGGHGQKGIRQNVLVSVADGSVRVVNTLDSTASPGRPSLSRDGRYIVYDSPARKDSPERDIFLLSTDGGREVPLVTQAGDDRYPVWTPDGRGILFLSQGAGNTGAWFLRVVDGKPQGSPELVKRDMGKIDPMGFARNGSFYYRLQSKASELYVATLDPTSGTVAAQPAAVTRRLITGQVSWSPDGQYLAYLSQRPSVQGEVGAQIVVIRSLANGEEFELAPALSNFDLRPSSWSSDGRSLLVEGRDKAGRQGLYRVDARSGDVDPLLYSKLGEGFNHPNWFLNGKSLVFIRGDSGGKSIVLHDLETGHDTELYRPPAPFLFGSCLEVSRDGQRLAFYLRDQEARSMWVMVMTAPGEKPRELGPRVKYPEIIDDIWAFTPDGRNVLFTTYDREQNKPHKVWQVAMEGGSTHEVRFPMDQLGYPGDVSFDPDGRRMAFTSYDSKSEVWVMENFFHAAQSGKASVSRR